MEFIHTPLLFQEGTEKGYDRCGTSNTMHSMLSAQAANPATFECEVYFCASAAISELRSCPSTRVLPLCVRVRWCVYFPSGRHTMASFTSYLLHEPVCLPWYGHGSIISP
jgi:hypothetical protein